MTSKLLSAAAILATAGQLKFEDVPCPEWGGSVRIAVMSGRARDQWELSLMQGRRDGRVDLVDSRAKLVAACAIDEEGKPLFTPEDVAQLTLTNSAPLDRCATVAQRLNKLTSGELEEAKGN